MLWRAGRLGISAVLTLTLVAQTALGLGAVQAADSEDDAIGRTPPRLSYADGEVSYFRPGGQEWAPAQVNKAVAPGDEFYTGNRGNLEVTIGASELRRAWGDRTVWVVR